MMATDDVQRTTPPDMEWVKRVCLIGQGAACCRYLLMGSKGWGCAKADVLMMARIDLRTDMTACADNCEGRGDQ